MDELINGINQGAIAIGVFAFFFISVFYGLVKECKKGKR